MGASKSSTPEKQGSTAQTRAQTGNLNDQQCTQFDHVVLTVADLRQAVKNFKALGFNPVSRGDSYKSQQESCFVFFPDGSYLQLCSFELPESVNHPWAALLARGECWADYSLSTSQLSETAKRAQRNAIPFRGPIQASGKGEKEQDWRVKVLQFGRGCAGSPALPFLVEDFTQRSIRVPVPDVKIPLGVTGIAGVTIAVSDMSSVEESLKVLLGVSSSASVRFAKGGGAQIHQVGSAWLELVEAGDSPALSDHVRRFGDGVYEVTLGRVGQTRPGCGDLLSGALTHGAKLRLELGDNSLKERRSADAAKLSPSRRGHFNAY